MEFNSSAIGVASYGDSSRRQMLGKESHVIVADAKRDDRHVKKARHMISNVKVRFKLK